MGLEWEFADLRQRVNALEQGLSVLAGTVCDILDYFREGGLSPEQVRRVVERLENHAAALEDIAADPNVKGKRFQLLKGAGTMAIPADLAAVLALLDTDTTAVAKTVRSLDALISTSMTPADVQTVKSKLADIASRLEATAADPNVPVPPSPPPPPVPAP